jgi:hypothetical protein
VLVLPVLGAVELVLVGGLVDVGGVLVGGDVVVGGEVDVDGVPGDGESDSLGLGADGTVGEELPDLQVEDVDVAPDVFVLQDEGVDVGELL